MEPNKIHAALKVLSDIATAYDNNALDDKARKFWGRNSENENKRKHSKIILYTGKDGKTLLTLEDCMKAREALKEYENDLEVKRGNVS